MVEAKGFGSEISRALVFTGIPGFKTAFCVGCFGVLGVWGAEVFLLLEIRASSSMFPTVAVT